jgi:hypothetical protein
MEPHWKETKKTMAGGCVGRLMNYENKKLETESYINREAWNKLQENATPGCKPTGRRIRY